MQFSSSVSPGAGRGGADLGVPTLNLNPADAPDHLEHGIYACRATLRPFDKLKKSSAEEDNEETFPAALHYGPKPFYSEGISLEVHLLDVTLPSPPKELTVEVLEKLREIQNFDSEEDLKTQMAKDIQDTRAILKRL